MRLTKSRLKQIIKEELESDFVRGETHKQASSRLGIEDAGDQHVGGITNVAAAVREAIFSDEAQVAVQNNRTAGYAATVIRNMARVMERAEALGPDQLEALEVELSSLVSEAINIRKAAEVTTEL